MIRRDNIVYNDQKDHTVCDGIKNRGNISIAAYLRQCVEFYEDNKNKTSLDPQLVFEYLVEIRSMLKAGILVAGPGQQEVVDHQTDLFDDILDQI